MMRRNIRATLGGITTNHVIGRGRAGSATSAASTPTTATAACFRNRGKRNDEGNSEDAQDFVHCTYVYANIWISLHYMIGKLPTLANFLASVLLG